MEDNKDIELFQRQIAVNRVTKVVKGGRRFSFSAFTVIGDKNGSVGYGFGKANEATEAIRKSVEQAKKSMIKVKISKAGTLPHDILGQFKSSSVLLKPAAPGTGIIAGGSVRLVLEAAGYSDVLSKSLGSNHVMNNVKAVFDGLKNLNDSVEIATKRGKKLQDIWG